MNLLSVSAFKRALTPFDGTVLVCSKFGRKLKRIKKQYALLGVDEYNFIKIRVYNKINDKQFTAEYMFTGSIIEVSNVDSGSIPIKEYSNCVLISGPDFQKSGDKPASDLFLYCDSSLQLTKLRHALRVLILSVEKGGKCKFELKNANISDHGFKSYNTKFSESNHSNKLTSNENPSCLETANNVNLDITARTIIQCCNHLSNIVLRSSNMIFKPLYAEENKKIIKVIKLFNVEINPDVTNEDDNVISLVLLQTMFSMKNSIISSAAYEIFKSEFHGISKLTPDKNTVLSNVIVKLLKTLPISHVIILKELSLMITRIKAYYSCEYCAVIFGPLLIEGLDKQAVIDENHAYPIMSTLFSKKEIRVIEKLLTLMSLNRYHLKIFDQNNFGVDLHGALPHRGDSLSDEAEEVAIKSGIVSSTARGDSKPESSVASINKLESSDASMSKPESSVASTSKLESLVASMSKLPESLEASRSKPESSHVSVSKSSESTDALMSKPESSVASRNLLESSDALMSKPESSVASRNKPESSIASRNELESSVASRNLLESSDALMSKPESSIASRNELESLAVVRNKLEPAAGSPQPYVRPPPLPLRHKEAKSTTLHLRHSDSDSCSDSDLDAEKHYSERRLAAVRKLILKYSAKLQGFPGASNAHLWATEIAELKEEEGTIAEYLQNQVNNDNTAPTTVTETPPEDEELTLVRQLVASWRRVQSDGGIAKRQPLVYIQQSNELLTLELEKWSEYPPLSGEAAIALIDLYRDNIKLRQRLNEYEEAIILKAQDKAEQFNSSFHTEDVDAAPATSFLGKMFF